MRSVDVQFFFTREDERSFSDALIAEFPQSTFMELRTELSGIPPERPTLDLCETTSTMIWNRAIYPRWPQQPPLGETVLIDLDVLNLQRSSMIRYAIPTEDDIQALESGYLSWGGGDTRDPKLSEMQLFAARAVDIIRSMHTGVLVPRGYSINQVPTGGVKGYVVGPEAARWCDETRKRILKVGSGRHLYSVQSKKGQ